MRKREIYTATISLLIGALLSGCTSMGNTVLKKESEASVQQKIVQGKTSKAENKAMFGAPGSTTFTDGGLEIWRYDLTDMHADPQNFIPLALYFGSSSSGIKKELVIAFDDNGIVKKFSMTESPISVKTGIFNN